MELINEGENIKGAEKFDEGVSSRFEYQLRDVLEKNKIPVASVFMHKAGENFNRIDALYFGAPSVEWLLVCFELLTQEAKRRHEKGGLSSGVEAFPEADQDAVKEFEKRGIKVD